MSNLFEQMTRVYEQQNWQMSRLSEDDTIMATNYAGKNGTWMFFASTDDVNDLIILFARAPEACPTDKRMLVSEFMNRATFRMTHGAWLLDHRDGEMRYRLGIDMGQMTLTKKYLLEVSYYVNQTMDLYWPGIKAIIAGEMSVIEACKMTFPRGATIE